MITGSDSETDTIQLYSYIKTVFKDASMNLREWLSNSANVNRFIPEMDQANAENVTVLGHNWDYDSDVLSIKLSKHITKRSILKVVASIFDPTGLFSPILLHGKVLLKTIWNKWMDWDDKIKDQEILMQWYELINDLERLSQIKIPRCISLSVDPTSVEYNLLCFCDASSRA